MDLLDQAPLVEQLHVPADGHVRDPQVPDEVGHPHAAILTDAIEDIGLALAG